MRTNQLVFDEERIVSEIRGDHDGLIAVNSVRKPRGEVVLGGHGE